tara:strand:+ start:193 stop:573 length:381 start_codon:yes stop_codon:yes gene_type:complete
MDDKDYDINAQINAEDYVIRIRPFLNDKGVWSGEVDLSIITLPGNPLDDDAYHSIMHLVKLMCSSVPVMETVEEVREIINAYVVEVVDKEVDNILQLEKENNYNVVKTYDGNVVYIDFSTKTRGSA